MPGASDRAGSSERNRPRRRPPPDEGPTPEAPPRSSRLRAPEVARLALEQLEELIGRSAEGVTSLQRGEQGWLVGVEVVETRRVPATTDVLALYEADLDEAGELLSYRRVERYPRGEGSR